MKRLRLASIALGNLGRKRGRTAAILAAFGLISATLLSLTLILLAADRGLARGMARMGADVMVVPAAREMGARQLLMSGEPSAFTLDRGAVDRLRTMGGVGRLSPQLFIVSASLSCCSVGNTQLVAFDPGTDFTIKPWLEKHRDSPILDNEVIVGADVNLLTGTEPRFYGKAFRVAGRLDRTGMDFVDRTVFIPFEGARRMIRDSGRDAEVTLEVDPEAVSAIMLDAEDMGPAELAIRIESGIPGVRALVASELATEVRAGLAGSVKAILFAGVFQWLATLALVAVVFAISLAERTREIGLLRAMGATRGQVAAMLAGEAAMLSGGGALLGIVAGLVFVSSFKGLIRIAWDIPFLWPGPGALALTAVGVFSVTLLFGIISTLPPVYRASRQEPYAAIREGE